MVALRAVSVVVVASFVLLSGCLGSTPGPSDDGSSLEGASSQAPQGLGNVTGVDLSTGRVSVALATDDWVTFLVTIPDDWFDPENKARLGLAIESTADASPYLGIGVQAGPFPPMLVFLGLNASQDGQRIEISRSGPDVTATPKLLLMFGTTTGTATVSIGLLDKNTPTFGQALVDHLSARKVIALAPDHRGQGGFAATAVLRGDKSWATGGLTLETESTLPVAGDASKTVKIHGEATLPAHGYGTMLLAALQLAGAGSWSYDVSFGQYHLADAGVDAWAAGQTNPFPLDVGPLRQAPALALLMAPIETGPATLDFERSGLGVGSFVVASWGWTSADFKALYGWDMPEMVLPEPQ